MKKVYMLVCLLVVVDIIEKSQQKQTSYQAAAARLRPRTRNRDGLPPKCNDQRTCRTYPTFKVCWPISICTT